MSVIDYINFSSSGAAVLNFEIVASVVAVDVASVNTSCDVIDMFIYIC